MYSSADLFGYLQSQRKWFDRDSQFVQCQYESEESRNDIKKLENLPQMTALVLINLSYNSLTEFPDLTNMAGYLYQLCIEQNRFPTVDIWKNCTALNILVTGGRSLVEFPDLSDVSSHLEGFYLTHNTISSVDYMPKMVKLKTLVLNNNQLRKFPSLTNLTTTLANLDLTENEKCHIEMMPKHCYLEHENRFTEFPDVSNISTTLWRLELFNNKINYMPERRLGALIWLSYLDMRDNPLTSLPNLCYLNTYMEFTVFDVMNETGLCCIFIVGYNIVSCTTPINN